jgi:hypothetical protein
VFSVRYELIIQVGCFKTLCFEWEILLGDDEHLGNLSLKDSKTSCVKVFIDGKIILKWPLMKEGLKLWTGLSWLAAGFSDRLWSC